MSVRREYALNQTCTLNAFRSNVLKLMQAGFPRNQALANAFTTLSFACERTQTQNIFVSTKKRRKKKHRKSEGRDVPFGVLDAGIDFLVASLET